MLAAVGFRLFGAVVDEDGTVNHILSVFSVYPHRDPYPPGYAQRYAVGRNNDAILRGLLFILYYYSCPWKVSERHEMLHA